MSLLDRNLVAEAVHRAVCEYTGTNGARRCLLYAMAGSALLSNLTGQQHIPQIGSLWVFAELPDGWFEIDITHWGDSVASFAMGEYHAWTATTSNPVQGSLSKGTIIDFSARHFKELAENPPSGETLVWNRPEPPKFLWIEGEALPQWIRLKVDPKATESVMRQLIEEVDVWVPLLRMAKRQYEQITRRDDNRTCRAIRRKRKKASRKRLHHVRH